MSSKQTSFRTMSVLLVAASFFGCSKVPSFEDAKKAVTGGVDEAKQAVENTGDKLKQSAGAAGAIELQLDAPVKSSGCYAALYVFTDGRPSVLQVTSYNDPSAESFPSMILRAETNAKAPANLNGQKLSAKAFVQENSDGAVWQAIDEPLEMSISAADDTAITASFQGSLVNVGTGDKKETTGTLSGSFASK